MSVLLAVGLGAVCAAGGCSHDGDVEIAWQFPDASGEPAAAADRCGFHGVDSVLVTGSNDSGDGMNSIGLCTPGSLRRAVPVGTWTFTIHTLDARGKAIFPDMPDGPTDPMPVSEGGLTTFPPIVLTPRPQCGDGIDNDGDGRVDLDDPDCGGDSTWTDEATPKP